MTKEKHRRNRNLTSQLKQRMVELNKIGQSRQVAKEKLKEKSSYRFGDTVEGIYSIQTMKNYNQIAHEFIRWAKKEGCKNRDDLQDIIKIYGDRYLLYRESCGMSVNTLLRDRAALNKLSTSNEKSCIKFKKRNTESISRSRNNRNQNNINFNEKNNTNLVALAKGTGGRRSDLAKLKAKDFFEMEGRLYVKFEKSKGGKTRIAVIREEFRDQIENLIRSTRPNEKIFERINSNADIHNYRRDYAKELYKDILKDKELYTSLTKLYGHRREPNIKGIRYKTRGDDNFFSGFRDDIYIISKSLGHNRLSVAVNHYLR